MDGEDAKHEAQDFSKMNGHAEEEHPPQENPEEPPRVEQNNDVNVRWTEVEITDPSIYFPN